MTDDPRAREPGEATMTAPSDPRAVLRTPGYVKLLVLAAIIGAPIAAAAYGFLWLVDELQDWLYTDLPRDLGFDGEPTWWPLPLLALAGLLVGLTIRYLPGKGGESPADGFTPGRGAPSPVELPGIFLAALAGLSLGVVIGPEAPLIALGGGLGVCAVRLASREVPARTEAVVAAAEVVVHEIEAVSAGLDALDEELGETDVEAAGLPPDVPEVEAAGPPPNTASASDEAPPPA